MSVPTDLIQAYNAYRGTQAGGLRGYGSAAANAAKLYGNLAGSSSFKNLGGDFGNILGIYGGIESGKPTGYAQAAVNAAQLGSNLGAFSPQVGQYAGYAAIPLSLYNEINNWESGATGKDALGGAQTGAAIGSAVLPGVGTLIGAGLGAVGGALSSAFGPGRVDPENAPFEAYTQAYNKATDPAQKAQIAASNQNPYLTLAGYFDLRPNQVKGQNPIYSEYGRMGEQKFTNDLVSHINSAFAPSGNLSFGANGSLVQKNPGGGSTTYTNPSDIAGEVYNDAVAPWINSMGAWNDTNKDALTAAMKQMTGQYVSGQAAKDWRSVGGDAIFSNVYQNSPVLASANAARQQGAQQQAQNQYQQALAAIPQDIFKQPGMGGATTALGAARGGAVKHYYDDGGDVNLDYFSDPNLGVYAPSNLNTDFYPDLQNIDTSGAINNLLPDTGPVNAYNDPSAYRVDGNSAGGTSGGLASLLKGLGLSGNVANSIAPYAALAPILGSMLGIGSKQGQAPGLPPQYGGQVLNMATPSFTRQQNNLSGMSMNDWLHAAEGPEIQYYRNNALPATQMSAPNQQAAQALSAATGQPFAGGYQYQPITGSGQSTVGGVAPGAAPSAPAAPPANPTPNYNLWMRPMAHGGPYDDPRAAYSQSSVGHVRGGPGNGTSDSVQLRNAYLSNDEYVMDALTMALIGNGSSEAGAKWMDGLRAHVRKTAGKHLSKGKQPMDTMKAADAYAYGGVR